MVVIIAPGGGTAQEGIVSRSQFIRLTSLISDGIDTYFYSWIRKPCTGYAECFEVRKASEFWQYNLNELSYANFEVGKIVKPNGVITTSIRSKMTFRYGYMWLRAKLPTPYSGGPYLWFGFEGDDSASGGGAHFGYNVSNGSLYFNVGNNVGVSWTDLTSFKPSDASTAYHTYEIVVKPWGALAFIDNNLRAIISYFGADTFFRENKLVSSRLYVGVVQTPMAANMSLILDIDGGDTSVQHVWNTVHPWNIRVAEGGEDMIVATPLWGADGSNPRGLSVSGSWTSMPFPGAAKNTILFVADTDGTLEVQGSTPSGFKTFETYNVTANKATVVQIERIVHYCQVKYTPSTGSGKIIEAHLMMQ